MQVVEKTVKIPQLPRELHDKSLTCPLLSTTGAYGPDSAENCVRSDHRDSTVAVLLKWSMSLLCWSCRLHSVGDSRDPTAADRRENRVPHFMAVAVGKGFFLPVLRAFFALRPSGR